MKNRAGTAPSCSINTPRGGSKPKIPPVPKLDQNQIQSLTNWANSHLQGSSKK
jgi:hypothetical protein